MFSLRVKAFKHESSTMDSVGKRAPKAEASDGVDPRAKSVKLVVETTSIILAMGLLVRSPQHRRTPDSSRRSRRAPSAKLHCRFVNAEEACILFIRILGILR